MASIGMNLGKVSFFGNQYSLIDRFKTSGAWVAGDQKGNSYTDKLVLDANGYPTSMPTGATKLNVTINVDPIAEEMTDRYVLQWEGTATFKVQNGKVIESAPGRLVFEYSGSDNTTILTITSMNAADPVTAINVVREDQIDLFEQGKLFNPAFLEKVSQWGTLRFMDWGGTNDSKLAHWEDRPTLDSASWDQAKGGVPIEAMVQLANEAGTDMWYCVPAEADDDYVTKAMEYVRDNLAPGLKLHLEYSNEVWNWQFDQAKSARDKGNLLWGTDVNGDGTIDSSNSKENYASGWVRYYGLRAAQIASIAGEVFGSDGRLMNVLATQTANRGLEKYIFQGIEDAKVGTAANLFEELAITTYFGNSLSGALASDKPTVLSWARAGEAGMDKAFQEMEFGGLLGYSSSLALQRERYAYFKDVADRYGMDLVAYEGGAHLYSNTYGANKDEMAAFFNKIVADPRMGDLYAKMAVDFADAGGTSLNAFTDTTGSSGHFALLNSTYSEGSARYDALVAAQQQYLAEAGSGGTPDVPDVVDEPVSEIPTAPDPAPTLPSTPEPVPTEPSTPSVPEPVPTSPEPVPTVPQPVPSSPTPTAPTPSEPTPLPEEPAPAPVPTVPDQFTPPTLADMLPVPTMPRIETPSLAVPQLFADTAYSRYRQAFVDVALASAQEMLTPQPVLHHG